MLTDTRQALLDAIRANPDDDAPRLIYADWLDENSDEERAQFIRLQCEEARLPEWHPDREPLRREHRRLFLAHKKRWQAGLPTWARGEFRRGFMHKVELTGAMFRRSMAGIWRSEPVAAVQFQGKVEEIVAAIADPLLQHVREVQFWSVDGDDMKVVQALEACPYLEDLQTLDMTFWPETAYPPAVLETLAQWTLPKLTRLRTFFAVPAHNRLVEPIQVALNRSRLWRTVTHAQLLSNRTAATATAFQQAPTRRLQELWLTTDADDAWLQALMASKQLSKLRSLTIPRCQAKPATWEAFFASPLLGRLTHLGFHLNTWSKKVTQAFLESPRLKQLQELNFDDTPAIDDAFVAALTASGALKKLRFVSLRNTNVTPAGVQMLQQAWPDCVVAW